MPGSPLELSRSQILAFRRRVGALEERLPPGARSLRKAAWAGLQDSMPRAALLSIHARVEGAHPEIWDDRSLVQVWGPRWAVYVVPARDHAIFTLGRHPDAAAKRKRAEELADRLEAFLAGRKLPDSEAQRALGVGNQLKYATTTGRVQIRWEGARAPLVWTVQKPEIEPAEARRELARRYLHIFAPTTPAAFAKWTYISSAAGQHLFDELDVTPVRTPIGEAWILSRDEPLFRDPSGPPAAARLLPSGDAFWLLQGSDRELLVPDARHRAALWTPRVWPGALLVGGEIVGTWRRRRADVSIEAWRPLTRVEHEAVDAEVASLPLPSPGDQPKTRLSAASSGVQSSRSASANRR